MRGLPWVLPEVFVHLMRRYFDQLRTRLVRVPRGTKLIIAGLILAVISLNLGLLYVAGVFEPEPELEPTFTYTGAWDLLELQQHIEAGEVVAISVYTDTDNYIPSTGAPDQTLVARTDDAQLMQIENILSVEDALIALRSAGYEGLLTREAIDVLPDPVAGVAPPIDGPWYFAGQLMMLLLFGAVIFIIIRAMRNAGHGGPGGVKDPSKEQARVAAAGATQLTWADVAGCEEAKYELAEVVEFLKAPERFAVLGAKIPRGVMLSGPSGTGKTLLAKVVASEAGVPFISVSGSDFVEMFVGRGAARVRALFAQARKLGKAVIFIDEFDAVGKRRGGANSNDEREQTLNAILVELDGFESNAGVVVVGATNQLQSLDPAVLRPGRFTRKVDVPLPDPDGRRAILTVHARNKPLNPDVNLTKIAEQTFGFSGADLADMLNEAAIFAAREGVIEISQAHLDAAWEKVGVGISRKRSMPLRERAIIAAHEAGHAIAGMRAGDAYKVKVISMYAHGQALGYTAAAPTSDQNLPSESDLRARLIALMGGRVAEQLLFHQFTGGAGNDFEKATQIATQMVTKWGMGHDPAEARRGITGRGRLSYIVSDEAGKISPDLQPAVDRAVAHILDEAVRSARETLLADMEMLRAISAYLVRHERMDGEVFAAIMSGELKVEAHLDEWRPADSLPRDWGEIGAFAASYEELEGPSGSTPLPLPLPVRPISKSIVRRSRRRGNSVLLPLARRLARGVIRLVGDDETEGRIGTA